MVALDLDGTALNSHHELSTKTIAMLRSLSSKGVLVTLATGRSVRDIQKYLEVLRLPQSTTPCVGYNGAYAVVFKGEGGEYHEKVSVFASPLAEESTKKLLEFAQEKGLVAQYYNGDIGEVIAAPKTDEHRILLQRYAELTGRPQLLAPYSAQTIPSAKMLLMTNDADLLIAQATATFPTEFHIIRGSPEPYFVEFLQPGVSKGVALQALCDYLGIVPFEVAAFGDGDNDKEMLQFAGMGVAMKNAKDAAKAAADITIEWTNDEDGVALQLEAMEKQGLFCIDA